MLLTLYLGNELTFLHAVFSIKKPMQTSLLSTTIRTKRKIPSYNIQSTIIPPLPSFLNIRGPRRVLWGGGIGHFSQRDIGNCFFLAG